MTPAFMAVSLIISPAATTDPLVSRVPPSHAPATTSEKPKYFEIIGIRTNIGTAQKSTSDVT